LHTHYGIAFAEDGFENIRREGANAAGLLMWEIFEKF